MKVTSCSHRPLLEPCSLEGIDYQVDPYVGCGHNCHYCYALGQAETDWAEEIRMHADLGGQLSEELSKIPPQAIYMGYHSDSHQPCEAEYCQTRQALELFVEKGFSARILTKSGLITRDIDLLRKMDSSSVSISVAFPDDRTRRIFEGNTIPTRDRVDALGAVRKGGIQTAALICPVIPYVTDVFPLIDMLAPLTDRIWIYGLSIQNRGEPSWKNVESILDKHYSSRKQEIESAVFSKDAPFWKELRMELENIRDKRTLNLDIRL